MLNTNAVRLLGVMVGLAAGGHPALAQPVSTTGSCQVALSALASEWNNIAFAPPSKPGQAVVAGRDGHVTSGAQFNFMAGQIRLAHVACSRGDDASAMQNIAVVRDILDRSNRRNS